MALQKQSVPINFALGLDLKTDPLQVALGRFLSLTNTVFNKGGELTKRNGFGALTALPNALSNYVTTFNGNLTAIGNALEAYSRGTNTWVNKGAIQPLALSVLPLIRSNTNQTQCDTAVSSTGLVATVYTDTGSGTTTFKYAVADATTGQNVIAPTAISQADATFGTPRVFALGAYFIVVFTNKVVSTYHLKYFSINVNTLVVGTPVDLSTSYTPSSTVAFDGAVGGNQLFIAWNGSDGGGAIRVTYLTNVLVQGTTKVFSGKVATLVSVCTDTTGANTIAYVTVYDSATGNGYTLAVDPALNTVLAATSIVSGGSWLNIASAAQNGVCTVIQENSNNYSYDSSIPSHFTKTITITQAGSVGTLTALLRSVGLASKAFIFSGTIYVLVAYQSNYQPTYFLTDVAGNVIAKLAYSNGGGYCTTGLPSANVLNGSIFVSYLFKDLVEAVNKTQGAATSAGIYAQTGINLAAYTLGGDALVSAEIAQNLHMTGGFVWQFDGYTPVEHNFHLWPDNVECTWLAVSTVTPTGSFASGSTTVTVSSGTGIAVGMTISDTTNPTYITAGTKVTAISGTTVTISQPTTHVGSGDTLSLQGNIAAKPDTTTNTNAYFYQVTYEWSDNQGNIYRSAPSVPTAVTTTGSASTGTITVNVPTLRLTYKTANPVKIVIYRWSAGQTNYYQVTSVTVPTLNSLTVDSIAFVDTLPDSSIIGNNLIYTTGGVVEDIAAPACSSIDLFDTRAWVIDAEDPNLLWFSKQVIEGTPVEWSDLFTMFVPPSTGAQGSTGPMKCLAPMDDKQIIFKPSAIYYVNGSGPDNTGASNQYSQPVFVTSVVGTSNQRSIVFQPQGLMFQADNGKGIWLLGRDLSTQYIGADVEDFNDAVVLSAVNIPGTNQVRFTLDNGVTLMYDYYYRQWGTFANVSAIASTLYQGLHTYINSSGAVFQETPGQYLDAGNPVLMQFQTNWIKLAGLQGYQRAYFFYLLGQYISPHTLTMQIAYDYNPSPSQSVTITPGNYVAPWGGGSNTLSNSYPAWGAEQAWGGPGNLEQFKVNLARQKCQAMQITFIESFDSFYGTTAGAGLTLSGLNCVIGVKKGYFPIPAAKSVG